MMTWHVENLVDRGSDLTVRFYYCAESKESCVQTCPPCFTSCAHEVTELSACLRYTCAHSVCEFRLEICLNIELLSSSLPPELSNKQTHPSCMSVMYLDFI